MTDKWIGIVAEDISDVEALMEIIPKIKNNKYVFRKALGNGCSRIKRKVNAYSQTLIDKGCEKVIVLIDSDGEVPDKLRKEISALLEDKLKEVCSIIIPVHELESWLLADTSAIHGVFSATARTARLPADIASPEYIADPKRHLDKLIYASYKLRYVNTIHNKKIAKNIDVDQIRYRCPSFRVLDTFIKGI